MARVHNFSAGPAALPTCVLREAQSELLDYAGSGMSVCRWGAWTFRAGREEEARRPCKQLGSGRSRSTPSYFRVLKYSACHSSA